jgi:hypothetical protein
MANLNPTAATDQLGTSSSSWAELHCGRAFVRTVQLPRVMATDSDLPVFATANSGYLHIRSDAVLYVGNARIAYYNDFEPTRTNFLRFMGDEEGTGVSGQYPHIPQKYDTLYSVALALGDHSDEIAALTTRVDNFAQGLADCCDVALAEISDVMLSAPQSGEALVYDAETGTWVNQDVSTVASLTDLTDVTLVNEQQGQVLRYNGTQWANTSLSIPAKLDDLDGVHIDTEGVSAPQVLVYDATQQMWANEDQVQAAGDGDVLQISDGSGGFVASDVAYVGGTKKALMPLVGQIDIGSTSNRFGDMFLSGSAYVGANSVHIGDQLSLSAEGDVLLINGSALKVGNTVIAGAVGEEGWLQAASPARDGTFMPTAFRFTFRDNEPYGLTPILPEGEIVNEETGDTMRAVVLGEPNNPFATAHFSASALQLVTDAATGGSVPLGVTYTETIAYSGSALDPLSREVLLHEATPINIALSVNGLAQQYGHDYTVDGQNIVWLGGDFPLEQSDHIVVTYTGA